MSAWDDIVHYVEDTGDVYNDPPNRFVPWHKMVNATHSVVSGVAKAYRDFAKPNGYTDMVAGPPTSAPSTMPSGMPSGHSSGSNAWHLPGTEVSGGAAKSGSIASAVKGAASGLDSMLEKAGFKGSEVGTMKGIIGAESGGNPNATHLNKNGTIDRGLAQINSVHKQFDSKQLSNPQYNLNAAHEVYKQQGFKAWSTYNSGAYKAHMGGASHVPVSAPGSPTAAPFHAASAARGHATTHPPVPGTAKTSPERSTRPQHATAKPPASSGHTSTTGHGKIGKAASFHHKPKTAHKAKASKAKKPKTKKKTKKSSAS